MDAAKEKELIEAAQKESGAFGALYDEYYPKIFGYVLTRTARINVTQDVTSEVFFKALKNLHSYRWRGLSFGAWLCQIANHEIANYYRANGHGLILVDIVPEPLLLEYRSPELEIEEAEAGLKRHQDFLAAQARISSLPLKYQEVMVLRFFENKKLGEIALIIGKSEATVKTLLYRGLDKLRKSMNIVPGAAKEAARLSRPLSPKEDHHGE